MAMSDAERKRISRQRAKEQQLAEITKVKNPDMHNSYLKQPFSEFLTHYISEKGYAFDLEANLDSFGVILLGDDFLASEPQDFPSEYDHGEPVSSLARATGLVEIFIEGARELAETINAYKRSEVEARITEIEQSDLSDSAVKKQAFADMAKLQKMRDQLDKQVRSTFPQWKVTGE